MITRTLTSVLRKTADGYPVVTLTGPRQSGKTTLVQAAFPSHEHVSLEDPDLRRFALEDPRGFLTRFSGPVIFDEAQRAPELFSYIQTLVDQEDRPGRFVLSGSQNFLLLKSIRQSLAGRCAVLHLLPLSLSELEGREPWPVDKLGRELPSAKRASRFAVMELLFQGFYPRIYDKKLEPQRWLANYYRTYVERDVRDLVQIGDLETFNRFVQLCAGRSGQLLNLASLASDSGISHTTARRWLSILETSFVVMLLRPHHRNFNKRLIKSPKLYFLDSGLLCYLLRIRSPLDLATHAARGAVFESFVIAELLKNFVHRGLDPDLYFWRDATGHEIDVLIEQGQDLQALEIKSGQTVNEDFFKGLRFWCRLNGTDDLPLGLIYAGEETYARKGVQVYSWSVL